MQAPDAPAPVHECRVIWFELYVDDVGRARRFYERVFNWTMYPFLDHDPTGGYVMFAYTPGGRRHGALVRRETPSREATNTRQCVVYMEVPDLPAAVAAVEEAGGRLVEGERPVGSSPGGGLFCVVEDTEGNLVGIWAGE